MTMTVWDHAFFDCWSVHDNEKPDGKESEAVKRGEVSLSIPIRKKVYRLLFRTDWVLIVPFPAFCNTEFNLIQIIQIE